MVLGLLEVLVLLEVLGPLGHLEVHLEVHLYQVQVEVLLGNGHKLMNGAPADIGPITGPDPSPEPGLGPEHSPDHGPDPGQNPGPDPASHDFLLSLLGGSDPFGPELSTKLPIFQSGSDPAWIKTVPVMSSALTLAPDPAAALDPATGHASPPALGQSHVSSVVDPAFPDSPDSPDYNGNGRLTVLSQSVTHGTPEARTVDLLVPHDLQGNMDLATSFPFELTASGLGVGPDATEPSHVLLHTESVAHITHLMSTGVFSQTDLVTAVTETATDSATDSGTAAVTDLPVTNTQPGPDPGPGTEPYNSQGPEGSENVELEDSC
uniref:Uncharacterized protein n=1 Tax=Knipowitschia caucasica TaxID=637954 RepID=A0AAV2K278_KNICA